MRGGRGTVWHPRRRRSLSLPNPKRGVWWPKVRGRLSPLLPPAMDAGGRAGVRSCTERGKRGGTWKHRYMEDTKSSSAHFWRGDMVRCRNATAGGSCWVQPLTASPSRGMHQRKFCMPRIRTYHPSAALERVLTRRQLWGCTTVHASPEGRWLSHWQSGLWRKTSKTRALTWLTPSPVRSLEKHNRQQVKKCEHQVLGAGLEALVSVTAQLKCSTWLLLVLWGLCKTYKVADTWALAQLSKHHAHPPVSAHLPPPPPTSGRCLSATEPCPPLAAPSLPPYVPPSVTVSWQPHAPLQGPVVLCRRVTSVAEASAAADTRWPPRPGGGSPPGRRP